VGTNGSSTNEGNKDPLPGTQESINASIADKNAKSMTDLMWSNHPSILAQKSAKTVFFEESANGVIMIMMRRTQLRSRKRTMKVLMTQPQSKMKASKALTTILRRAQSPLPWHKI
jgi:hypothetical protein